MVLGRPRHGSAFTESRSDIGQLEFVCTGTVITNANIVWRQRTRVTSYIRRPADTQARRRLRSASSTSLDVRRTRLQCPLSATERFLSQPLVCGTVFYRMSLLSPLSPSSAVVLNHISSHFLILLSDSSLICTVPSSFWTLYA